MRDKKNNVGEGNCERNCYCIISNTIYCLKCKINNDFCTCNLRENRADIKSHVDIECQFSCRLARSRSSSRGEKKLLISDIFSSLSLIRRRRLFFGFVYHRIHWNSHHNYLPYIMIIFCATSAHSLAVLPNNIVISIVNINEMWGNRMMRITMAWALDDAAAKGRKKSRLSYFQSAEDKWEALAMIQREFSFVWTQRLRLSSTSHKYQLSTQTIIIIIMDLVKIWSCCSSDAKINYTAVWQRLKLCCSYNMLSSYFTSFMHDLINFCTITWHINSRALWLLWTQFSP